MNRKRHLFMDVGLMLLFFISEISCLDLNDLEYLPCERLPCMRPEQRNASVDFYCSCGHFYGQPGGCSADSSCYTVKETQEECTLVESLNISVFMVSKCNPQWDGNEKIKEYCEGGIKNLNNPVTVVPVTSTMSGVTYASIFCAACNYDGVHIVQWELTVTREEYFAENARVCAGIAPRTLEYTDATGIWSWGYWHYYKPNYKKFITVDLEAVIPTFLKPLVKYCCPGTVSQCAENWTDEEIRGKCRSYVSLLKIGDNEVYRNIHCAVCNHVTTFDDSSCLYIKGRRFIPRVSINSMTLSYPHRMPDTSCVEAFKDSEYSNDIADGCKTVICDPGYAIVGDHCKPAL